MPQKFVNHTAIQRGARAGWTMPEAVAALAVTAALIACLALSTREGRRQASLGDNFANLKQFAEGTAAYVADNADRVWTFSWRAGVAYGDWAPANTDLQAGANQAVDIIRRRGNRPDMFTITGWVPHVNWSHLVLLDYLEAQLPARFVAAPQDRLRLLWQSDPTQGFYSLGPLERPSPLGADNNGKRWPYSSSYELAPAFVFPDARIGTADTVAQASTHNSFYVPQNVSIGRNFSRVRHPSQKVMIYETFQRHFGSRVWWFGYSGARVPALFADGHARILHTADTHRGFHPNSPYSPGVTFYLYEPALWEPPSPANMNLPGHYRWTRSGILGRDIGGPEVPMIP